ncbi:tyrosine-protein phosphatase [Nonlabens antarcticus]|uniref:tyrosine-protein phosphatase n=1 Tax=Nonlabens antarcticus TaxID=392714 RepID=UPI0018918C12|nr:CpsB/CapC family capsule biosynthesis tyrosine phosphatase [Nonlabens antarcticus]
MTFFSRKIYLVDLLEGMVDIHNHLLPGIDDGSPDLATTLEMIAGFKALGFKGVYTTPHTMEDYYGNDVESIVTCFHQTKNQLGIHADFLLGTSSEYMMDGGFGKLLETGDYQTLPDNHLLFEFSYFQKPQEAEELIFEMDHKDLNPILAHPERYRYLSPEEMLEFKERGCALQLNLLSLSGHYGKDALRKAMTLLEANAYDFLGTDAHRVEHLTKIKETKLSKKQYSQLKTLVEKHKAIFI